jgi:hypothetical protein
MAGTFLTITPSPAAFGNVSVGLTQDIIVNFSLTGSTHDVLVNYGGGLSAPFTEVSGAMPFTLDAGNSYSHNTTFRFSPVSAASFSNNITVIAATDDVPPIILALTGTGVTATKNLSVSPVTLDFGTVPIGSHKDITFTIINSSAPTAAITGSVGSPGGSFTILSGGGAFSLAANGDTKGINIRYAPTVAGPETNSLAITHDATTPSSPFSYYMQGNSFSPTYQLLDTTVPAGTISIATTLDLSLPQLFSVGFKSAPATTQQNLLINMDQHNERVDAKLGQYEYDALQLEFMEDYTVYPQGLWYKIFRDAPGKVITFLVTMLEGGVARFVAYGNVDLTGPPDFTEHALTASQNIRTIKFQLISGLDILKNVTASSLVTEALTHHVVDDGIADGLGYAMSNMHWVLLLDILASAVHLAFSPQTFAQADCQIRNEDIQLGLHDVWAEGFPDQAIPFSHLYMIAATISVIGYVGYSYLDGSYSGSWINSFGTAFDIVQAICFPFGFVPRYFFGQDDGSYLGDGSDRHHIELISRGRAGNLIAPIGVVRDSHYNPTTQYQVNNVRTILANNSAESVYISNGGEFSGQALPSFQADIDLTSQFDEAHAVYEQGLYALPTGFISPMCQANMTSYWDYIAKALVGLTYMGSLRTFLAYLCEYFYRKFHGQSSYVREYGDVRALDATAGTTTQWNLRCLKRTQITDETGIRNYYAIEVDKDYFKNVAKVTWFEE